MKGAAFLVGFFFMLWFVGRPRPLRRERFNPHRMSEGWMKRFSVDDRDEQE